MSEFSFGDSLDVEINGSNPSGGSSVLDDMRADLAAPAEVAPISIKVPLRPSFELIFNPSVEFDLFKRWMNNSTTGPMHNRKFDPLRFAYAMVAFTNTGVRHNGKIALDSEGQFITVKHKVLKDMLKVTETRECIHRLFGGPAGEGHIMAVSQRLVEAAGYGDSYMEAEDASDSPLDD